MQILEQNKKKAKVAHLELRCNWAFCLNPKDTVGKADLENNTITSTGPEA